MPREEVLALVIALVNRERARHGLKPLRTAGRLMMAAQAHADDMARVGYFAHDAPDGSTFVDRAEEHGYRDIAGENIAWGQRDPSAVVKAWMVSEGHRDNILDPSVRATGVGMARRASDGALLWVQEFGRG